MKDGDEAKEPEPWIGLVPVEMDDSKASTGNQESFADAMVNKVSVVHAGSCFLPCILFPIILFSTRGGECSWSTDAVRHFVGFSK